MDEKESGIFQWLKQTLKRGVSDRRGSLGPKVIIFTGISGRLGLFFSKTFASEHIIIGISRRKPEFILNSIDFFQADVTRDAEKITAYVLDKYKKIDIVVNNAVFYNMCELREKSTDVFKKELETNVVAPLELANTVLNNFWIREGGEKNFAERRNVVNISSTTSITSIPKQGTYSAVKAALNALTRHMAREYIEYGIRVNAVAPNRFGSHVLLEDVCSAIMEFSYNNSNGRIKIMDRDKKSYFI